MSLGPTGPILILVYGVFLAIIAFFLEMTARLAHRRSMDSDKAGFSYHRERDVWICPEDQHLFPIFSDPLKGAAVYRAPASVCNACPSKHACTDSDNGRIVETRTLKGIEYGMQRFQRAFSLTLLILAAVMDSAELFRSHQAHDRALLALAFIIFSGSAWRASMTLRGARDRSLLHQVWMH
jgi:hypothetical protein